MTPLQGTNSLVAFSTDYWIERYTQELETVAREKRSKAKSYNLNALQHREFDSLLVECYNFDCICNDSESLSKKMSVVLRNITSFPSHHITLREKWQTERRKYDALSIRKEISQLLFKGKQYGQVSNFGKANTVATISNDEYLFNEEMHLKGRNRTELERVCEEVRSSDIICCTCQIPSD
jgi:hypothetical protein